MLRLLLSLVPLVAMYLSRALASADLKSDLKMAGVESVFPDDTDYPTDAECFNHRFSWKPAVVTYPTSENEVSDIVKIAAAFGKHVAARSGGHSYIANGCGGEDDAIVIDVKYFNHINVSSTGIAAVGTGNRNGNIGQALTDQGLDTSHGTCPYVGLGGHITYGGYGYQSREWGLALDNIVEMDAVLPNGTFVKASEASYPDLFWALRGAGGSFGVVTTMYFKTHPIPPQATTYRFNWTLGVEDSVKAFMDYQAYSEANPPNELGIRLEFRRGEKPGTIHNSLTGTWNGPWADFDRVLGPLLKKLPPNPSSFVLNGTYYDSLVFHSDKGTLDTTEPDDPDTFYAKSLATPDGEPVTENAVRKLAHVLVNEGQSTSTTWFIQIELWGGDKSAINTVPYDATSFILRDSLFVLQFYTSSGTTAFPQEGITFLDNAFNSIVSTMPKGWHWRAYTDYIEDDLQNWEQLYYDTHYSKLQQLKKQYDPQVVLGDFPTGIRPN